MKCERESELRMALRHVKSGQNCILRQYSVIEALLSEDLPTEDANVVLRWLQEKQREFEDRYKKALADGFKTIELSIKASPPNDRMHLTGSASWAKAASFHEIKVDQADG